MKLILACTAVVLLSSAVELARPTYRKNSIESIFRVADITPVPQQMLEVNFEDLEITPGIEICPEDAIEMPTIGFDCEPGCYYTFITINLDYSLNPLRNPALLNLRVNLRCDSDICLDLEDSCELACWAGPAPGPGTGINRYVMYALKQNGMIDTANETLLSAGPYMNLATNYYAFIFRYKRSH
ncbi:uncharacterized protein [Maniola hyperantus]|uniref:uncharacterized protein isoform X2 n=1 Tax=Aphantopus hyperantus TaxID=2795564 RepID=UPI0037489E8C